MGDQTEEKLKENNDFEGLWSVFIGAVVASFMGHIKYVVGARWGIPLPFFLCLLTPILGGIMGYVVAKKTYTLLRPLNSSSFGGFIGGIFVGLATYPYPWGGM